MPLSTDVTLPIDHRPEWPSRCVRCGQDEPTDVFRFRASRVGFDQLITLNFAIGSRPTIEAPACPDCAKALRRARRLRLFLIWPAYIILGIAVLYTLDKLGWIPHGPYRKWIMTGIVLLAVFPFMIWEGSHPAIVGATARHKKLDYEFRDPEYAENFAELNDAETW